MKQRNALRAHRGFTVIEMLVVVVVIGIIIAIIGPRIPNLFAGSEATRHATEMGDLTACIRNLYSTRTDYATLEAGVIAQQCGQENRRQWVGDKWILKNPSGNALTFTIPTAAPINWVEIGSPGVPSAVCLRVFGALSSNFAQMSGQPATASSATVVQPLGGVYNEQASASACGTNTTSTLVLRLTKG